MPTEPGATERRTEEWVVQTYERSTGRTMWDVLYGKTLDEAIEYKPRRDGEHPQRIIHRVTVVTEQEVEG